MNKIRAIKENIIQINAIVEKNVKLNIRFKLPLILSFIRPLISLIIPIIIMGQLFTFTTNTNFGPWDETNYVVFQLVAWHLGVTYSVMNAFPAKLKIEKFWQTLPALLIAPFKRINLLIGIFISYFIMNSISFIIFFVICYIFYPISFLTVISILFIYFLIAVLFSGIGLFFGVLAISKENFVSIFQLGMSFIFSFSCISLPFQFFPNYFQNIALLNPLYYIIDLCRLVWIENNIFYSIIAHPINILVLIFFVCTIPITGYYLFELIFKKYGIVGY